MEVILKQDVKGIGKAGSVVKVKDGFARNCLFPKGLALEATRSNLRILEEERKNISFQQEKLKGRAEELKKKLSSLSLTMTALPQDEENLYGSIGIQDIQSALKDEGVEIDKSLIAMEEPIKKLGVYEIPVKLHPLVNANIKVWVVKK